MSVPRLPASPVTSQARQKVKVIPKAEDIISGEGGGVSKPQS